MRDDCDDFPYAFTLINKQTTHTHIYLFIYWNKDRGKDRVDERRGRRRKKLLDVKETEAPYRTLSVTRFGRGCGAVARQTTY